MDKFEYRTLVYDTKGLSGGMVEENRLERQLNDLGGNGWELVNTVTTSRLLGFSRSIVCVFKRLLKD